MNRPVRLAGLLFLCLMAASAGEVFADEPWVLWRENRNGKWELQKGESATWFECELKRPRFIAPSDRTFLVGWPAGASCCLPKTTTDPQSSLRFCCSYP